MKAGDSALTLRFNASLLRGERVTFDAASSITMEDTALYVLVNTSVDFSDSASPTHGRIVANHHPFPDNAYLGPFASGNEMGVGGWFAVTAVSDAADSLQVDLAHLPAGAKIGAVR